MTFNNQIQREKLEKTLQLMKYRSFSILAPYCYYSKIQIFKNFIR